MSEKQKKYCSEEINSTLDIKKDKFNSFNVDMTIKKIIGAKRLTPLKRFVFFIGQDPSEKSRKQMDKISATSRYKEWLKLRKMIQLGMKIKKQQNESIMELVERKRIGSKRTKLDYDDITHRHVSHRTHSQKLRDTKSQIINSLNTGLGHIHNDPTTMITANPKAKHAFMAMGKGKTVIRKRVGHRPQRTFRMRIGEDSQQKQEITNQKEITITADKKAKDAMEKAKTKVLRKNSVVEINPKIDTDTFCDDH